MIQEDGRALVWSLARKVSGDTTGMERKILSIMETTNFSRASGIDTWKTITSLVSSMLTGSALKYFLRSSFFGGYRVEIVSQAYSMVSAKWVR